MGTTIEQVRSEVQRAFERLVEVADGSAGCQLQAVEKSLWTLLLALGRSLVGLYLARQVERPRAVTYEHDGLEYELAEEFTSEVGVRFGRVPFTRQVGRRVDFRWSTRDLPVDREIGLSAGFSLLVVVTLVKLCAHTAFATARRTFHDVFEWSPSQRSTLRMVDAVGEHAQPFLEQAPAPDDDGEVMMLLVDGKGAPCISSRERARRAQPHRRKTGGSRRHQQRQRRRVYPRVRRKPGKKSKNAKMAAVAVLYTMRRTPSGLEGPLNKRLYASFTSYRDVFAWIQREAIKRGYGTKKISKIVFAADGADTLWDLQQEFFPDAVVCLDWYHVVEKLWSAGKCLHRHNGKMLAAWVDEQKRRLRRGQLDAVIADLDAALAATARTGPGNKYRRVVLEKTANHFRKNAERMRYHLLRRQDLDIGTGVVEGAVRHLVGMRLDGPGMRWGRDRAEMVLRLRCILFNGQWDDFVDYLAAKTQVPLRAQPIPARTHDAKAAA